MQLVTIALIASLVVNVAPVRSQQSIADISSSGAVIAHHESQSGNGLYVPSLMQRGTRTSSALIHTANVDRLGKPSSSDDEIIPIVFHTTTVWAASDRAAEYVEMMPKVSHEKAHTRSNVPKTLGTDLLGDALEPTDYIEKTEVAHSTGEHSSTDAQHHSHNLHIPLLFFFVSLAIGSVLVLTLERFHSPVPYTCALFGVGVLLSLIHWFKPKESFVHWPTWYHSIEQWEQINPHLLFYAFLPPLLFGEAMRMNTQLVRTCFPQVLLLACPGVVLGTFMTGCVGKFVMPYGWDWSISLLFGSILSATDPVAVVALFNTLGVSPRLTMLISGESLLNDGTAIVVFALMLKVALGATVDALGVITFFGQMTISAVILGFLIGGISVFVIGVTATLPGHSSAIIQAAVSIVCGYLAFFFAESEVCTSGVIATVSSAYIFASFAWPCFVSRETMRIVWETLEFVGNTVIFTLAGLIFSDTVLSRWAHIEPVDFVWLLALYFILMLIRATMIAIFWIPLNAVGSPLHWTEGAVMVWSGLRGAVSLTLAIIVDLEPGISKEMGSRIIFHVGGIAAMTLLFNATLTAPILRILGVSRTPRAKERMLTRFAQHVTEHTAEAFEKHLVHADDVRFVGANRHVVQAMVPSLRGPLDGDETPRMDQDSEHMLGQFFREAYLVCVQNHYWTAIDQGIIPRDVMAAKILLHSTDEALDNSWQCLNDWEVLRRDLMPNPKPGPVTRWLAAATSRKPLIWIPHLRRAFSEEFHIMQRVYLLLSFQEAHQRAQEEIPKHFASHDATDLHVQQQVAGESATQCHHAAAMLDELPAEYVELGRSEMLARKLLHMQAAEVAHMQEKGLLTSSEASGLEHQIRLAARRIQNAPKGVWLDERYGGAMTLSGQDPRQS